MSAVEATYPPLPEAVLRIGMTGHRPNKLPAGEIPALKSAIGALIRTIGETAQTVATGHRRFLGERVRLVLLSALAEGADRIAAEAALAEGWQLQCPLPFTREEYKADFAEPASRAEFDRLLTAAHSSFEIDGKRGAGGSVNDGRAYETAGLVMLEASDLIIAVWDGKAAEGIGGTAVVIERALQEEVPVLLVDPGNPIAVRLLWRGFDPLPPANSRVESLLARTPLAETTMRPLIEALLAPPSLPLEAKEFEHYLGGRPRTGGFGFSYPILLALMGLRAAKSATPSAPDEDLWMKLMSIAPGDDRLGPTLESGLRPAYTFADRQALHYAQSYRNAFVFNYLAAATAVAVALGGLFVHSASGKAVLVLAEIFIIASILLNTRHGQHSNVHGRWLDYRRLAERLRQMRFLTWSGASSRIPRPVARLDASSGARDGWVDWYARAVRRTLPLPNAVVDAAYLDRCRHMLTDVELKDQIAYHHCSSALKEQIDRRLHAIGNLCFWMSALTCLVYLAYYLFGTRTGEPLSAAIVACVTWLSAFLPALGAAAKATRAQGDFKTIADRSAATAAELEQVCKALSEEEAGALSMSLLADRTEKASAAMLRDLLEWRLHSQTRPLSLPA